MLAAAGSVAILAGGMALAGAGAASAASLPSCTSGVNCTNNSYGTAGYYGADDNHTHYRFVQTVTVATPQLVNLNGTNSADDQGAVGVELCDPNIGYAAQISLGHTAAGYEVAYTVGKYFTNTADPCSQNVFEFVNPFKSGTLLDIPGVSSGDKIYLAIYYTPGGSHFHQLSFGACDITSGVCRQAYSNSRFSLNFWEFGIGAFSDNQQLTAPALNTLDTFSSNQVTCYSCSHSVNITTVSPVNAFNIGGLYEAQFVNSSTQVTLSPNDSLSAATDDFTLYNGSTSS